MRVPVVKLKKFLRHSLLLWAASSAAMAQNPGPDAASKVLALERLWAQAMELRDLKAMDQILDNAFVLVDLDGRVMNKAGIMAYAQVTSGVHAVVESTGSHVYGNTVIVTGILRIKSVQHGKPYTQRGRYVDTWLYEQSHWACIASVTTPAEP
jgi:ketosteroid isomerase-like protein